MDGKPLEIVEPFLKGYILKLKWICLGLLGQTLGEAMTCSPLHYTQDSKMCITGKFVMAIL